MKIPDKDSPEFRLAVKIVDAIKEIPARNIIKNEPFWSASVHLWQALHMVVPEIPEYSHIDDVKKALE